MVYIWVTKIDCRCRTKWSENSEMTGNILWIVLRYIQSSWQNEKNKRSYILMNAIVKAR